MGATPKSSRSTPTNQLKDYILRYEASNDVGLFPVSSDKMEFVPGLASHQGIETYYYAYLGTTAVATVDMQFNFNFNQTKYRHIGITPSGAAFLLDPSNLPSLDVGYNFTSRSISSAAPLQNWSMKSTFSDLFGSPVKDVVLAPWFDRLRNTFADVKYVYDNRATSTGIASNTYTFAIQLGMGTYPLAYVTEAVALNNFKKYLNGTTTLPEGIDSSGYGVKFYRGRSSEFGNFFLIRWHSFSNALIADYTLKFDLVLYENGTIEFRYDKKKAIETSNDTQLGAVVGIFAGSNTNYRDFGNILKRDTSDSRGEYQLGGAVYDTVFTDTSPYGLSTTPFICSLKSKLHWPGQDTCGAMFTFSPPKYAVRGNRSIIHLRNSQQIIGSNSAFDDQKTIPTPGVGSTMSYVYPSMLPVDSKLRPVGGSPSYTTGLFQSGSIQIERKFASPNLLDDVFHDVVLSSKRRL